MVRRPVMGRRMLTRRVVAAANMTALLAETQMDPVPLPHCQAVLTPVDRYGRRREIGGDVGARVWHGSIHSGGRTLYPDRADPYGVAVTGEAETGRRTRFYTQLMGNPSDRAKIEAAIAAQEQLRETFGDDIVDATVAALRAQLDAPPPTPSIQHERRLVTVLFMDVVDSTRIFGGLDPEEVLAIMDTALETLADPVRAHGGRVTKFMGDGFLAVFGLRRTRENDAEMAVRAGLEIAASARAIADEVAASHRVTGFAVRIGINTGLVATGGVTEAEDTVIGSAVNLASRIESAAPPGGVLVSQSTYRQVRGRFETEPAGTIDAKGFPEPVAVHLVTGERTDRPTGTTRGIDNLTVAMVGRESELRTLLGVFDDVVSSGQGRTVTVIGDAGIGKTRLLAEFESNLPRQVTMFRARGGLESTDVPNSLLRDLVERCFDIRSDDPVAVVREKLTVGLGAYFAADRARTAKIRVIRRFLGYEVTDDEPPDSGPQSPQQLRDQAVLHLSELFQGAAAADPVLLLLDDLQWADTSSLAIVAELVESLATYPVLTIGLTRPALEGADWHGLPNQLDLQLAPLSPPDAESLIDSILSNIEDCPPELRMTLLEHSGGNPYYLEELVMMCIDDGVIVVDDPAWSVHMDRLAALRVPATLAGVIRARLDGLPSPEHTVLQQASVVGRVFWDEVVARIAATSGTEPISGRLHSLHARKMIRGRPTSTFSNAAEYAFSNALLRDATYEEVLLATRRKYHGIIAEWLIATSGDREREFVGLIAGHLENAGRSTEAIEYLERAGEAAWNSYAVTTAADFYERALALVPADDLQRRYRLLLNREKALALEGDRDEQRRAIDALETIADEIGDPTRQSVVAVERTFLCFYTGDYPAALASAQHAVERAAAGADPASQSRVETTLGWAYHYLQNEDEARLHGERALQMAQQAGPIDGEANAQNLLGMVALTVGRLSEGRTRTGRALELARAAGDVDAAMTYLNNHAVVLTMLGNYDEAGERFSEILDRATESGDRMAESSARVNLAWVAAARGDWETARAQAERAIAMKRRQEHREAEAEALLWLGHALVGLDALDEANSAYSASAELRRQIGQTTLGLGAEAGLTRVALARSDAADAMSHAEAILDHLDRGENLDGTWEPLRIHLTVFDALTAAGDGRAERVLQRAGRLLQEGADMIGDGDDRTCYLEAIPWHRRIRELTRSSK
jgi:class 3 adenylate cyclase/tetratricopeptide (TPR) repeat protein